MHRIPVHQIMQTTVVTIHPDALVADAAQILEEFHIRRLPVINEEGCLVGIITNSDIREAEAVSSVGNPYEPATAESWLAVGDVMTREIVTVEPTATVGQLAVKLMEHKISGLPVVEREGDNLHLVGIVSETDIFRMIADAWAQSQMGAK